MATTPTQGHTFGDRMLRKEDGRFIRGKGRYVDDVRLPGMLHSAIVRSPFAHAKINNVDVSAALELEGVHAVITGADLPKEHGRPRGWTLERDPFMFETSIPGVFAAGDVRACANRRVAAAVGEGSAAIYSVHRYLRTV